METTKYPDGKGGWIDVPVDSKTPAQSANAIKQQARLGDAFLREAGLHAEALGGFDISGSADLNLTLAERVYGYALHFTHLRETYPDGQVKFDSLAAAAHSYAVTQRNPRATPIDAAPSILDITFVERAGRHTERLRKFDELGCADRNLTPEQRIFANALYYDNLRYYYPEGEPAFDRLADHAYAYRQANVK